MKSIVLFAAFQVAIRFTLQAQTPDRIDLKERLATITNLQGKVFTNITLQAANKYGIIYTDPDGAKGQISFTNLDDAVLNRYEIPTNLASSARLRAAQLKAQNQAESSLIETNVVLYNSIANHRTLVDPISKSAFPQTEQAQTACKEMVSELKEMRKALELGLSYGKFSDILTEKAMALEKIKTMRGEGVSWRFTSRTDEVLYNLKESRKWWKSAIDDDDKPTLRNLDDYFMRKYWQMADVGLAYCTGIAEKDTDANDEALDQIAELIQMEQDAVANGILGIKNFDPTITGLTVKQIRAKLEAPVSSDNAPSTNTIVAHTTP